MIDAISVIGVIEIAMCFTWSTLVIDPPLFCFKVFATLILLWLLQYDVIDEIDVIGVIDVIVIDMIDMIEFLGFLKKGTFWFYLRD